MAYSFYLGNLLLPVSPSELKVRIGSKNESIVLMNGDEINILKKPKLKTIEFMALIPRVEYPFASYNNGFQDVDFYLEELKKLKNEMKSFSFIVNRYLPNGDVLHQDTLLVSLEEYEVIESAENGFDVMVSISLKEYREYGIKIGNIDEDSSEKKITIEKKRSSDNSPEPKKTGKTYEVVKGDTLWLIAKKFYGSGSKYEKIFLANKDKIKNPNTIYPGQVLKIPV